MSKIIESIKQFFTGMIDSLRIFTTISLISTNYTIFDKLKNCFLLNGVIFLLVIFVYSSVIEPFFNILEDNIPLGRYLSIGKYLYILLLLIPCFLTCNILTTFWIDDMYYETLKIVEKTSEIQVEGGNVVTAITNQLERTFIIICFLIQNSVLNMIPIPGVFILKYVTFCILNSLYVFEYILMQKYIKDYKSIMIFMENRFSYFLGYGILFTIMINLVNSITINSAIFLLSFPLFLISSVEINNLRFSSQKEIKNTQLIFFYPISKFHDFVFSLVEYFYMKNKKKNKNTKKQSSTESYNDISNSSDSKTNNIS